MLIALLKHGSNATRRANTSLVAPPVRNTILWLSVCMLACYIAIAAAQQTFSPVMSGWCQHDASILLELCHKWCEHGVNMMSEWCQCGVNVMPHWCHDDASMTAWAWVAARPAAFMILASRQVVLGYMHCANSVYVSCTQFDNQSSCPQSRVYSTPQLSRVEYFLPTMHFHTRRHCGSSMDSLKFGIAHCIIVLMEAKAVALRRRHHRGKLLDRAGPIRRRAGLARPTIASSIQ